MEIRPTDSHRPDARRTSAVLTIGTAVAVVCFALAFAVRFVGLVLNADFVATVAVILLLATPALGLVTTAIELRRIQRPAALLAVLVLAILTGATTLALLVRKRKNDPGRGPGSFNMQAGGAPSPDATREMCLLALSRLYGRRGSGLIAHPAWWLADACQAIAAVRLRPATPARD
jgi:hypothetical protein